MKEDEDNYRIAWGTVEGMKRVLRQINNEFTNPNIPLQVIDGGVFWEDVDYAEGWKLQQHIFTEHARIITDDKKRVAWGSLDLMKKILSRLKKPWINCKAGDILAVRRTIGYYHFAVYIGNGRVIHYAAENGDFGENKSIHEAPFSKFLLTETRFAVLDFPERHGWPEHNIVDLAAENNIVFPVREPGLLEEFMHELRSIADYHVYSPEETVRRAKSRISEQEYNLISNNCEHFAVWCKTGISESRQSWIVELFKAKPFSLI